MLLGIAILIAIGAASVWILLLNRPEESQAPPTETSESLLTSNRYAEAREEPTHGLKCLGGDTAIDLPAEERTDIEYTSMSHVYDIPAGTELDVNIASYSDDTVTGSNLYEGDYGNYNFVLSKQNGNWAVTEYKRCEI